MSSVLCAGVPPVRSTTVRPPILNDCGLGRIAVSDVRKAPAVRPRLLGCDGGGPSLELVPLFMRPTRTHVRAKQVFHKKVDKSSENRYAAGMAADKKEKLYVFGSLTTEAMWLEPRKWWQFWRPRFVEKYRAWETRP